MSDPIDDYVTELTRLNHQIEDAAAREDFEDAGRFFTELPQLQHDNRQLAAAAASMIDLNRAPSRALGIPRVGR